EDGIRDFHVTGVQTCALPIYKRDPCIWTPCATTREKRAQGPPWAGASRYHESGSERAVVRRFVRTASHSTFGPSLLIPAHRNREGGPCAIATPGSLRIDYVSGSPEPSFGPREQRTATPIPIVVRVGAAAAARNAGRFRLGRAGRRLGPERDAGSRAPGLDGGRVGVRAQRPERDRDLDAARRRDDARDVPHRLGRQDRRVRVPSSPRRKFGRHRVRGQTLATSRDLLPARPRERDGSGLRESRTRLSATHPLHPAAGRLAP